MYDDEPAENISRTRNKSGALRLLKALAVTYLLICLLMMFLERFLVYHPPPARNESAEIEALGGEEAWFTAKDGTNLHGWYFAHPSPQRAILYATGNGEDAGRNAEYMAFLRDHLQASMFVFDYRGYGLSKGQPHESGLILDGIAAQDWLAEEEGIGTEEIVLFGRSLGGGVMVAVAEKQGAQGLIIHSSFANMVDVGASHYPWLPVRWLMKNRFESEDRIKKYTGPLLQIHGTADGIVPLHMAKPLFDAAPTDEKQFIEVLDGTHNEALTEEALNQIADFLKRVS